MHGREEKCIHIFGWKPERKRPLGRLSVRWEGNTKINLTKI